MGIVKQDTKAHCMQNWWQIGRQASQGDPPIAEPQETSNMGKNQDTAKDPFASLNVFSKSPWQL